jgi:hypothetical protein
MAHDETGKPQKPTLVLDAVVNFADEKVTHDLYPRFPWIPISRVHDGDKHLINPMHDDSLKNL